MNEFRPAVEFLAEELEVVPQAKKAWAAPRVILSEIEQTATNAVAGADAGGSTGSNS